MLALLLNLLLTFLAGFCLWRRYTPAFSILLKMVKQTRTSTPVFVGFLAGVAAALGGLACGVLGYSVVLFHLYFFGQQRFSNPNEEGVDLYDVGMLTIVLSPLLMIIGPVYFWVLPPFALRGRNSPASRLLIAVVFVAFGLAWAFLGSRLTA